MSIIRPALNLPIYSKNYVLCKTLIGQHNTFKLPPLPPRPTKLKKEVSLIEALDLPTDTVHRIQKRCLPLLFTFKEYMEHSLYDEKFGYYTTRPGVGTDFETVPMINSPHYGAALAEIIMKFWMGMVRAGTFSSEEQVDICELGAGTGILARDIVSHLKNKAESNGKEWKQLYKNLSYTIGEISPKLRVTQALTTVEYWNKINIKKMDARKLNTSKPLKGFILSNELPDAFSVHKIRKNSEGAIQVALVVFEIPIFSYFLGNYKKFPSLQHSQVPDFDQMLQKDFKILKNLLNNHSITPNEKMSPFRSFGESGYISKETYRKIRKYISPQFFNPYVRGKEYWISTSAIPEVDSYCKDHPSFIDNLPCNEPFPLNTDVRLFQKGCGKILEKGFQITIDYQYTVDEILATQEDYQRFRMYPSDDSHNYRYPPGSQDITTDVNATALAVEGIRAGFEPFLYCREYEMFSTDLKFLKKIDLPPDGMPFNVLFMKKRDTKIDITLPILSRPVTYLQLDLKKWDRTWSGTPTMQYSSHSVVKLTLSMYHVYKILGHNPTLKNYKKAENRILETFPKVSPQTKNLLQFLFRKLFWSNDSLFKIAEEYQSVSDFDYKRIVHYFRTKYTSDKMDRTLIQMIQQLLQLYYADRSNCL